MSAPAELPDADRRALRIEIAVVLAVTFGLSAYTSILDLVEAILLNLSKQTVALNPRLSPFDLINLGLNLARVAQLVAWGALGVYLLWRSGIGLSKIGLGRIRLRPDVLGGLGLAALIGLPGLGLYVAARALGLSVSVVPSTHDELLVAHPGSDPHRVRQRLGRRGHRRRVSAHPTAATAGAPCRRAGGHQRCCAAPTTSTRAGARVSATPRWAWCSATPGSAPAGCGRWSSRTV